MFKEGDHDVLTPDEARGGTTNHNVRYVLAFSLGGAILIMSAAWIIAASTRTPDAPELTGTTTPEASREAAPAP
ncbi:MAG: hypothetical protein RLZZ58_1858 [Pseudomonadota bacterium]